MDRTGADFFRVVDQMKERLRANAVPIQIPIGAEDKFEGIIDLVTMKAMYWNEEDMGMTFEERDIPEALLADAENYRSQMIEAAAESSEELMDKYLEGGELTEEEIRAGIRARTLASDLVPVCCGTAFKNKGVQALLDDVIYYLPSPTEVKDIAGVLPDGEPDVRESSDEAPFSALAFKLANDPFVGN